jgi:hypothetical protein
MRQTTARDQAGSLSSGTLNKFPTTPSDIPRDSIVKDSITESSNSSKSNMTSIPSSSSAILAKRPQLPFLAEIRARQPNSIVREDRALSSSCQQSRDNEKDKRCEPVGPAAVTSRQPQSSKTKLTKMQPDASQACLSDNKNVSPTGPQKSILEKKSQLSKEEKTVQFTIPAETNGNEDELMTSPTPRPAPEPAEAPKRRSKRAGSGSGMLRLTEKSNMAALADSILPQLNEMQKNYLGKSFLEITAKNTCFFFHNKIVQSNITEINDLFRPSVLQRAVATHCG